MRKQLFILSILLMVAGRAISQDVLNLSLKQTISMAKENSLEAFRSKNMYLAGYWEHRSYRAARLPSVVLELTPARYNRNFIKRYDSNNDYDVYREQKMFSAAGGFNIVQNFDLLGGTFYMNSNIEYLRNFGDYMFTQYSTIPFRIGYSQNTIGFNPFRWDRKIEPLKFEKAKKEYLYNTENIAEKAVRFFFSLALADAEYKLAKKNKAKADTLYAIGEERKKIAGIQETELLTLKLDKINSKNSLENAAILRKRAMQDLAVFLDMDKDTQIKIDIPKLIREFDIPIDRALGYAKENNHKYIENKVNILKARKSLSKAKVESFANVKFNASVGFNQVADNFKNTIKDPLRQDLVMVSLSVPLIDWGVRRGKKNMARSNLNIQEYAAKQTEINIEKEIIVTIEDFLLQKNLLITAQEALDIANIVYEQTNQRFIIGKADVNSITLATNRLAEAQRNFIIAENKYWMNYYKIRKLTLYDFENNISLSRNFDFKHGL